MKARLAINFSILVFAFFSITIPTYGKPQSGSSVTLEEIDLGLDGSTLLQWYNNQSGLSGSETLFGAYVIQPVEDDLYIGLSSYRPAENDGDGSYFAKFDGTSLSGIGHFDEQGIHEMLWDGSKIHIAGTDPHDVITTGNNWDTGNHYSFNPETEDFTKYRDVDNGLLYAFHTWGLWKEGYLLFAAASSHDGTYPSECENGVSCKGQIFLSINNGDTWTKLADLGDYRAYDIIGFNRDLFAIHNDELTGPLSLSKSTDGGISWDTFPELSGNVRRSHLVTFNGKVIAASFDRTSIYAIDELENVNTHSLPAGFLLGAGYTDRPAYSDYNVMETAGGFLYLIAEDANSNASVILRTFNMETWEEVSRTEVQLISLTFWNEHNWIVTSSNGANAKLWAADLNNLAPLVYLPLVMK